MAEEGEAKDWVSIRVAAAATSIEGDVPGETTVILEAAMRSTMGERTLRQQELTDLAQLLIQSTDPNQSGEDDGCE